jgi:hypothetical protein
MVEEPASLAKQGPMTRVVQHQHERPHQEDGERQVRHRQPPTEPPGPVEIHGERHNREIRPPDEMQKGQVARVVQQADEPPIDRP